VQREDLRVRLRERSEWEALELGREMCRHWRGSVYRAWGIAYATLAILSVLAFWRWPLAAPLVIWWLKPCRDRVLLFVYSQHVFGHAPSLADLRRAVPALLGRSGLWSGLTLRRFSFARALLLPVWQLEGQRGSAARSRARVLGRRSFPYAAWLTLVCAGMTVTLALSAGFVIVLLVPVGMNEMVGGLSLSTPRWVALAWVALLAMADAIVEPLYVASGFSLYLNRRSELEAWDVELGFRALAARFASAQSTRRPSGLVALVLAGAVVATGDPGLAAQAPASAPTPPAGSASTAATARPKVLITDVLRDPVFGAERQVREWRPKTRRISEGPSWLARFARSISRSAELMRLALWPLGAGLLAWLIVLWSRQRPDVAPPLDEAPTIAFGMDVRPESLPEDVPAAAHNLIEQGHVTAALGLLYRAALSMLIQRAGVRVAPGDTEGECTRRAEPVLAEAGQRYFRSLVTSWQRAAYAGLPPSDNLARSLCDGWSDHFDVGTRLP